MGSELQKGMETEDEPLEDHCWALEIASILYACHEAVLWADEPTHVKTIAYEMLDKGQCLIAACISSPSLLRVTHF